MSDMSQYQEELELVYDGEYMLKTTNVGTGPFISKFLICPNCLRATHLVKFSPGDEYNVADQLTHEYATLHLSENEFREHVQKCESVFERDGIHKSNYNPDYLQIIDRFNIWSHIETKYHQIGRTKSAYIYVVNGRPVSYISIHEFDTEEEKDYILADAYTFPKYRGKNLATILYNHAIEDLNLNREKLVYSCPLSLSGAKLLRKVAKDQIIPIGFEICGAPQDIIELDEYILELSK